jgi:hypothetical protein
LHTKFLNNFLLTSKSKVLDQTRILVGLHASGYIFPFSIFLKLNQSLYGGIQFMGFLTQERITSVKFDIVNDLRGTVFNISSSVPIFFDVDLEKVNLRKVNITDIVPDFLTNIDQYTSKVGHKFRYNGSDYFLIAIPLELRIGGLWGYIVKIETHIWNLK